MEPNSLSIPGSLVPDLSSGTFLRGWGEGWLPVPTTVAVWETPVCP